MKIIIFAFVVFSFGNLEQNHAQEYVPFLVNDKYGYSDINGNIVCKPKFDRASLFNVYGWATIRVNNKIGFIDSNFNQITNLQYSEIKDGLVDKLSEYDSIHHFFYNEGIVGVLDTNLNVTFTYPAENISYMERSNKFRVSKQIGANKLMSIIDKKGKTIIPFQYKSVGTWYWNKDYYTVVTSENKCGIIDSVGNIILDTIYDEIPYNRINGKYFEAKLGSNNILFNINYKPIAQDVQKGYYNFNPLESNTTNFDTTLLNSCNSYEFKNTKLTCTKYEEANICVCHYRGPKRYDQKIYINRKPILDFDKFKIVRKTGKLILIKKDDKYGIINVFGDWIIELDNQEINSLYPFIIIKKNDKFKTYDLNGILINNEEYDFCNSIYCGVSRKTNNGNYKIKYALLSTTGERLSEFKFDEILHYDSDQLIIVKKENNFIIVDTLGEPIKFLTLENFESFDNNFKIFENGLVGLMNKKGDIVVNPIYTSINKISRNFYRAMNQNVVENIINAKGDVIVLNSEQYKNIKPLVPLYPSSNVVLIENKAWLFDKHGEKIKKIESKVIVPTRASDKIYKSPLFRLDNYYINGETGFEYKENK